VSEQPNILTYFSPQSAAQPFLIQSTIIQTNDNRMSICKVHLLIGSAYILIPVELLASLYYYGKLAGLSRSWLGACFLVMLNFVAVGVGYLLAALEAPTALWETIDCTISLITALYLVPLVPQIISQMDCYTINQELVKLNEETAASKRKLFTFMNCK
jgi:hypothetical protein